MAADFAAGWAAGAASTLVGQPLDTLLVRVQAFGAGTGSVAARGTRSALRSAIRAGPAGLRGLWSGWVPMVLKVPVQNALMFAAYGAGERAAQQGRQGAEGGGLLPVFVGGTFGGVVQSAVVAPVELLKTTRQLAPPGAGLASAVKGLSSAVQASGPMVLFRGLSATILRDGIPHGVWFAAYAWAKRRAAQRRSRARASAQASARSRARRPVKKSPAVTEVKEELSAAETLAAGAFAAAVAWAVGYPADPIKTRIQAAASTAATEGAALPGIRATSLMMLREAEGNYLRAFYRGFGLKLAKALPCSAISFLVYESCKAAINERQRRQEMLAKRANGV